MTRTTTLSDSACRAERVGNTRSKSFYRSENVVAATSRWSAATVRVCGATKRLSPSPSATRWRNACKNGSARRQICSSATGDWPRGLRLTMAARWMLSIAPRWRPAPAILNPRMLFGPKIYTSKYFLGPKKQEQYVRAAI